MTIAAPPLTKVPNYVNGQWVESTSTEWVDVTNPATGKVIAKAPLSSAAEVAAAVEAAAAAHEPHRIAFYLYDLASEFHALWTKGRDLPYLRFIINNDAEMTKARLAMVQGVVTVLASGLGVLGVGAPNEMR